ncbi:hypothetical protein SAMN05216487_1528 [Pseudomonas sp. UC 17F4]|nr:hypothetical protein SAMN05216487_1528 [Pseudomonas sp. UC 17F4]
MIITAFFAFATLGISLALLLKKRFTGADLGWTKFLICLTCNVFFGSCYLYLVNHEKYTYLRIQNYSSDDYPLIGWLSMALVLFHGWAYPRKL